MSVGLQTDVFEIQELSATLGGICRYSSSTAALKSIIVSFGLPQVLKTATKIYPKIDPAVRHHRTSPRTHRLLSANATPHAPLRFSLDKPLHSPAPTPPIPKLFIFTANMFLSYNLQCSHYSTTYYRSYSYRPFRHKHPISKSLLHRQSPFRPHIQQGSETYVLPGGSSV